MDSKKIKKINVGVIANPQSGKDIRRIVSDAFTINNFEKLNILKRIINAALSISNVNFIFMPDQFGFGKYLKKEFPENIYTIKFDLEGETDTEKATEIMIKENVCCIVVLGGDGTNRLVAKQSRETPIIPISTGTNNAFPFFYEGTIVGSAIGAISKEKSILDSSIRQEKRIEILKDHQIYDIALIDAAIIKEEFIGSKAVINTNKISTIFVSFGSPLNVGLSSIFGFHLPVEREENAGGMCELGENGNKSLSPIMPGKLYPIKIKLIKKLPLYEEVKINERDAVIALDGERKIYLNGDEFSIRITKNGPKTVNIENAMKLAVKYKLFYNNKGGDLNGSTINSGYAKRLR